MQNMADRVCFVLHIYCDGVTNRSGDRYRLQQMEDDMMVRHGTTPHNNNNKALLLKHVNSYSLCFILCQFKSDEVGTFFLITYFCVLNCTISVKMCDHHNKK